MYGKLTKAQQDELEALRKRHKVVSPQCVLEFATDPTTALHRRFTWDDSKAAYEYRLWQARQVLRVAVSVLAGSEEPVRAFVSLQDDRGKEGYRWTADVLSDAELRQKMLDEAMAELRVFQRKYRVLSELAPVFEAAERVAKQKANAKPGRNGQAKAKRKTTRRREAVGV